MKRTLLFISIVLFCSCKEDQTRAIVPPVIPPIFSIVEVNIGSPFQITVSLKISDIGSIDLSEVGVYVGTEPNSKNIFKTQKLDFDPISSVYKNEIWNLPVGKYYLRPYLMDKSKMVFEGSEVSVATFESIKYWEFNPTSGGVGSSITIRGLYIGAETIQPEVYIGNVRAEILFMHPNDITVIVPKGITANPIKIRIKNSVGEFTFPQNFILLKGVWTQLLNYQLPSDATGIFSHMSNGYGYVGAYNNDNDVSRLSQNFENWTYGYSFPNTFNSNGDGLAMGSDKTYYVTSNNEVWEFVVETGSWENKSTFPISGESTPVSFTFSINDVGYVGKMYFDEGNQKIGFWKKKSTDFTWSRLQDPPFNPGKYTVVSLNGIAYLFEGYNGNPSKKLWKFDPASELWEPLQDAPYLPRYNSLAFNFQDKLYVGGGLSNGISWLTDFYEYDPPLNKWIQIANIPSWSNSLYFYTMQGPTTVLVGHGHLLYRFELEN
ncbi:MAG: IPT/TIG domain-containing protein [Cyclobacteriaceae bacterium]